jgi:hypothetical protein
MDDLLKYNKYRKYLFRLNFFKRINSLVLLSGILFLLSTFFVFQTNVLIIQLTTLLFLLILMKINRKLSERINFNKKLVLLYKLILNIKIKPKEENSKKELLSILSFSPKKNR